MNAFCVITTINKPTAAVKEWEKRFGTNLIVVGDEKTPLGWKCGSADYCGDGSGLSFDSVEVTPYSHYARKNLGYLEAMKQGAKIILDTDDDNAPLPRWHVRGERCKVGVITEEGWCNVYSLFSRARIWPRGLPLNKIGRIKQMDFYFDDIDSPIQQGLAAGNPDVDAIWRLVMPRKIMFGAKRGIKSFALGSNTWSPFNSQSTWWFPDAFPLMYLPIHATFRMTDIWRSFAAQRCLWAMGKGVVFHSPAEVVQERNEHDLMADFSSEIPGYLHNEAIAEALEKTKLKPGKKSVLKNLRKCYEAMVSGGFLPKEEFVCLDAWIADIENIRG